MRLCYSLVWSTLFGLFAAACAPERPEAWAITNVSVIDVVEGVERRAQTVVIEGRRIVSISPTAESSPPQRRIDGTGGFLIPGFWDMHAHLPLEQDRRARLREWVAHGTLGVRALNAPIDTIPLFRNELSRSGVLAPRVVFSGPANIAEFVGWKTTAGDWIAETDSAAARSQAEALTGLGVWQIKVHDFTDPNVYEALVQAARDMGLAVVGHVPTGVTTELAIASGQRSFEHLGGLFTPVVRECGDDPRPRARLHDVYLSEGLTVYHVGMGHNELNAFLDSFDEARCRSFLARLAADSVWQVPNLLLFESWAETAGRDDIEWDPSEADHRAIRKLYDVVRRVVRLMHEEGVPMLAGVDWVAGKFVQDELELMTEAGIPIPAALRIATVNAARFLGVSDSLGRVEAEMVTDLVLLADNPLDDIRSTRLVRAVIVGGEYLEVVGANPN